MILDFTFTSAVTQQRGAAESFIMFPDRLLIRGITHHSFISRPLLYPGWGVVSPDDTGRSQFNLRSDQITDQFCQNTVSLSFQQERLESLKQSIEFMSGLDPSTKPPGKSEEQGEPSLDQNKEGPATTESSESSQTPCTPRSCDPPTSHTHTHTLF